MTEYTVEFYVDESLIDTKSVEISQDDVSDELLFEWDTSGESQGTYPTSVTVVDESASDENEIIVSTEPIDLNGAIAVTDSTLDEGVRIYKPQDGSFVNTRTLNAHGHKPNTLRFSPSNRYLAIAGSDAKWAVYETESWTVVASGEFSLAGTQDGLAWSPSGKYLYVTDSNEKLHVFDRTDSFTEIAQTTAMQNTDWSPIEIKARPDGEPVAVTNGAGDLGIVEVGTWNNLHQINIGSSSWYYLSYTPNSDVLVVGGSDGDVYTLDAKNGYSELNSANFDYKGEATVATRSNSEFIYGTDLLDVSSLSVVTSTVVSLSERGQFNDSNDTFVALSGNDFELYDEQFDTVASGSLSELVASVDTSNDGSASSVPSNLFAYASTDNNVYVYNRNGWGLAEIFTDSGDVVWSLTFSPDGSQISSASTDNSLYVYNTSDWSLGKTLTQASNGLLSVDYSSDGSHIAYGSVDGNLYIHDTSDWGLIQTLSEAEIGVTSVSFSPDGSEIAYSDDDSTNGNVYVHDTSDWSLSQTLTQMSGPVRSVAYSPDGSQIAYGGNDGNVYVHDTSDWSLSKTLTQAQNIVYSVAYSPDGSQIAYGTTNDDVFVQDTSDWSVSATLTDASNSVLSVGFSPDGSQFASASGDGNAYVYDTSDWSLVQTFPSSDRAVRSVSFGPV